MRIWDIHNQSWFGNQLHLLLAVSLSTVNSVYLKPNILNSNKLDSSEVLRLNWVESGYYLTCLIQKNILWINMTKKPNQLALFGL